MDYYKRELRKLFDVAAAKSIAFECSIEVEGEMGEFVRYVIIHPFLKDDVIGMLIESFSDDFYMKWAPIEFWQYCVHYLRWPELVAAIEKLRDRDIDLHGSARSNAWGSILEAADDKWEGAQYYKPI